METKKIHEFIKSFEPILSFIATYNMNFCLLSNSHKSFSKRDSNKRNLEIKKLIFTPVYAFKNYFRNVYAKAFILLFHLLYSKQ